MQEESQIEELAGNDCKSILEKMIMIEVKNLKMAYGKREVLKGISFHIKKGKTVGLLGVNGAGKSTTMNLLTGYLTPSEGKILIHQTDMRKYPGKAKKYIGYLPEIPPLYKDMKVLEYLMFAAAIKGIREKKKEVDRVTALLDMEDRKNDFIKNLSKGYQQRIGFAQALLGNPEILILDEPLVGLDPAEAKKTKELISSLREDHAIIISSHILSEIEELCHDILILKEGLLVLDNSTVSAKRRASRREYRLTIKGDRDKIQEYLERFDGLQNIQYLGEKEPGVFEFSGTAKNARDIRDSIFSYLVSRKLNVYAITKVETSLEDVFMEVNSKEEQ